MTGRLDDSEDCSQDYGSCGDHGREGGVRETVPVVMVGVVMGDVLSGWVQREGG